MTKIGGNLSGVKNRLSIKAKLNKEITQKTVKENKDKVILNNIDKASVVNKPDKMDITIAGVSGAVKGIITQTAMSKLGAATLSQSILKGALGLGGAGAIFGGVLGGLLAYGATYGETNNVESSLKAGAAGAAFGGVIGAVKGAVDGAVVAGLTAMTGLPGLAVGLVYEVGKEAIKYGVALYKAHHKAN